MSYNRGGYNRYSNSRYRSSEDNYHSRPDYYNPRGCSFYRASGGGALGFVTIVLFIIGAMPVAGCYYLISGKDSTQRVLGAVLLVVGITLWIAFGLG